MLKKSKFFRFCQKNEPLRENFQNSVLKGAIATPTLIDVLCSNVVKFGRREIGKIVHYLPDKKISLQLLLLRRSRPKSENVLRVLQISSKSVHFWRSYFRTRLNIVKARSKVNPIFG